MNGTAKCTVCGERDVPREEWPGDRFWPIVCEACLRATAWGSPGAAREPAEATAAATEPQTAAREAEPAPSSDFGSLA